MYKNVASQVVLFYAYNTSTETAQTGDSANITCQVSIDGGSLADLATNTASEIGRGVYSFTTAQADNNGDALAFIPSSTTANVSIEPLIVFTLPSELETAVSGLTAPGTTGGLVRGSDTDSLGDVADAVLDELITGHTTADSLGQALADVRTNTERVDALIADVGDGDQFTETALELAPSGTSTGATAAEVWAYATKEVTGGTIDVCAVNTDMVGTNNAATPADVNEQVLDVLTVDTFTEPTQGTPSATTTIIDKIGMLYKSLINKKTSDGSTESIYNSDGVTIDHTATIADDGTTATKGSLVSGS